METEAFQSLVVVLDQEENIITATPDHLGIFAILGVLKTTIYLPIVVGSESSGSTVPSINIAVLPVKTDEPRFDYQ